MADWNIGKKNGMWKGGRSLTSDGYVLIRVGVNHHLADVRGYAYEHRLVAEKKIGRRLRKGEEAHHKNEIRDDNRPRNIVVCKSKAEHRFRHRKKKSNRKLPGQPNRIVRCACGCHAMFKKFDSFGRPRMYVSGHNGRKR